jgi:hypothetical protein
LLKKNNEDFLDNSKNNHVNKNIIYTSKDKIRNTSEKNNKNKYYQINYEGNKNLKKSRENLGYYLIQSKKEKRAKIDFFSFVKLIFLKLNKHKNNVNKEILSKLIFIYQLYKLKDLLNYTNIKKVIISQIKTIMIKSSEIYNINTNQEIANDDEFLKNVKPLEYNETENKNKINQYINGLEKIKEINNEINDIYLRMNDFIEKYNNIDT